MIDIRCCDNLELMKTIEDNSVDLIYCDKGGLNAKNFNR